MTKQPQSVTLITGGSKGIGLALAHEFARHEHNLLLVARNNDDLEQAAGSIREKYRVDVHTMTLDLTSTGAAQALFRQTRESQLQVDVLVNNAGTGMVGKFAASDFTQMTNMLRLNVLLFSQLTHLFLQPMLKRGEGRILNVASLVAYFSGAPNWVAYVASKHYVLAFSRGLAHELQGSGVTATVISPGPTATSFVDTAGATDMRAYQLRTHLSVEQIASVAYKACIKGKTAVVPGVINKILAFLGELHPRRIAFEIFAVLSQEVPKRKT